MKVTKLKQCMEYPSKTNNSHTLSSMKMQWVYETEPSHHHPSPIHMKLETLAEATSSKYLLEPVIF